MSPLVYDITFEFFREYIRRIMMTESILYKRAYHIDLRDVDFRKQLKLSMLFSYFQDVASFAAYELGVGITELAENNGIAWILMRIRVEIERMPVWNEEITIETWPQEPGKLEIERDFIVRDSEGKIIVRAVSAWVLMDLKERKLKRTSVISLTYPSVIEERAIVHKLKKLESISELETAYEKVIGYSDIDFNGHLNNSRYIDYIMDCFSLDEHNQYETKAIEVNFNREALPGDTIVLQKSTQLLEDRQVFIEGMNKEDEKAIFKAKVDVDDR